MTQCCEASELMMISRVCVGYSILIVRPASKYECKCVGCLAPCMWSGSMLEPQCHRLCLLIGHRCSFRAAVPPLKQSDMLLM